jgi:hypothetical protein
MAFRSDCRSYKYMGSARVTCRIEQILGRGSCDVCKKMLHGAERQKESGLS